MYGVVEVSGHQYKVQAGDLIDVEKLSGEVGSTIELDKVLFIGGETPVVGLPVVDGAKVTAKVVKQDRARKIVIYKNRKGDRSVTKGHRQHFTGLLITEIDDGKGNVDKIDAKSKNAEKYLS